MEAMLPGVLGLITGLLLGLTGAGGGILAAPLLMLVMHLPLAKGAPISLIAMALGAGLGMLIGLRQGIVRYRAAFLMAGAGLLATPFGIHLSRILPNTPLVLAFSALLAYQAWRYWRGGESSTTVKLPCVLDSTTGRFIWNRPCALAMLRSGMGAGFLSGLLGVGGGFILVPALRKNTTLPMHSVTATSLMVLALISTGGLLQWSASSGVEWAIGIPFALGAVAGMAIARQLSPRIPEAPLRRIFASLCLLASLALLVKVLAGI
ncbi:sulfite exporter TauE/SafE family protein [Propionivibrio sp.]|uniref:sulfite exporter TauE/SafE family protein n=1 Tax=Propionivibrio sp. TaxID=2212460 RepID=UPI003BF1E06C